MAATQDDSLTGDSQRGGAVICKALLDAATPEMFSRNAFRLTGLPVDARTREITKRADKLEIMGGVGWSVQTGALATETPPTRDQIREAIQRLKDPEQRIIDEFFWFWPREFGQSARDPAIKALEGGDADTAFQIWTTMETNPANGHVAMHNIAVLRQLMAMEWENDYARNAELTERRRREIDEFWRGAFQRWNALFGDELLWENVSARIKQLDDPRLTSGFARRMRATLPSALAKLNAGLALRYAESGKMELARVQVQFMREIKLGPAAMESTAELALAPATARLKQQVQQTQARAAKTPRDGVKAALELLEHTRRALPLFELFFGKESELRNELSDEVAWVCNGAQITYHQATHDHKSCLELLKMVLPLGTASELRSRIEQNIQILETHLRGQMAQVSSARLKSLLMALRGIDEGTAPPEARLAKIKQELVPALEEMIRDEGAGGPSATTLANSMAISLRGISLIARRDHNDFKTGMAALTLAFELARDPELKHQLTQDQAVMARRESEVKRRLEQDKAQTAETVQAILKTRRGSAGKPVSSARLESLLMVLRSIDEGTAPPEARLAKIKKDLLPALEELIREEGAGGPSASALANSIAASLYRISLDARRNHGDFKTGMAALTLAAALASDPELKHQLTQDKALMASRESEVKTRLEQEKAQKTGPGSGQKKNRESAPAPRDVMRHVMSTGPVQAILKALRESAEKPSLRLNRFKSEVVPVISNLFADTTGDSEMLVAVMEAAAVVLREISMAAWEPHKDIETALAANELASKYTLEAEMRKRLGLERSNFLRIDAEIKKRLAAERSTAPQTKDKPAPQVWPPRVKKVVWEERPVERGPSLAQRTERTKTVIYSFLLVGIFVFWVHNLLTKSKVSPSAYEYHPIPTGLNFTDFRLNPTPQPVTITLPTGNAPPTPDGSGNRANSRGAFQPRATTIPMTPFAAYSTSGYQPRLPTVPATPFGTNSTGALLLGVVTTPATPSPANNTGAPGAPAYSDSELERDRQAIDREKAKAGLLAGQLKKDKQELDNARRGADQLEKQVANLYEQVNEARAALDQKNPSAVSEYNRLADVYTAMAGNLRVQNENFRQATTRYNTRLGQIQTEALTVTRMLDDYNSKLRRNRRPNP